MMSIEELQKLHETCSRRINELEAKYYSGARITRTDCQALRVWVQRLGLIAREIWLVNGQPDDPEFACLQKPIALSPLPASLRTWRDITGGH